MPAQGKLGIPVPDWAGNRGDDQEHFKFDSNLSSLPNSECTLEVKNKGIAIEALLDSGVNHSIIGPALLNIVPDLKGKLVPVNKAVMARAVNGSTIAYKQEVTISVEIDGQQYEVKAYYSPLLPYHLVLGYDFLQKAKMTINFGQLQVRSQQGTYLLKAYDNISLQPCSETIVWAQLKGSLQPGLAVLLEVMEKMGFTVAHTLITINEKKT